MTGFEKAAYRGGCQSLPELLEGTIRHEEHTDIIALLQPESVDDPLTEIARDGARRMLAAALTRAV